MVRGPFAEPRVPGRWRFKRCHDPLTGPSSQGRLRLFRQLTGLELQMLWIDPWEALETQRSPVLCPVIRGKAGKPTGWPAACEACLRRHWSLPVAFQASRGHQVHGHCGGTWFWVGVQVEGATSVTLAVRAGRSRAQFRQAVAFLRVILHDFRASAEACQARSELEQALVRSQAMEIELTRLRQELRRRAPDIPVNALPTIGGPRRQQLVSAILDYINAHYRRPFGLHELAVAFGMNPSYVSSLFAEAVGITFHEYLAELRLARAKELLCDPRIHVCDVACSVGFTSAGHFCRAFKAHTGLSPSRWREGQPGLAPTSSRNPSTD